MRMWTKSDEIPSVPSFVAVGAAWYLVFAAAAALSVFGATSVAAAVSGALLAGFMAAVGVAFVIYGRAIAQSGIDSEIESLVRRNFDRSLQDESEDQQKAA